MLGLCSYVCILSTLPLTELLIKEFYYYYYYYYYDYYDYYYYYYYVHP